MLLWRHVTETKQFVDLEERKKSAISIKVLDDKEQRVFYHTLKQLQFMSKILLVEKLTFHLAWSKDYNVLLDLERNQSSFSLWSLSTRNIVQLICEFHKTTNEFITYSKEFSDSKIVYFLQGLCTPCTCVASSWEIIQHCTKCPTCSCKQLTFLRILQASPWISAFDHHRIQLLPILLDLMLIS